MSSNNYARPLRTPEQRLIDVIVGQNNDFIQKLKAVSSDSAISFSGLGGAGGNQKSGAPVTPTGNFLSIAGGAMSGGIAFTPKLATIASDDSIDITPQTGHYTGYIIIATSGGLTDDLGQIIGAQNDGQFLLVAGIATETVTIKDISNGGAYNIKTPNAVDYILKGPNSVLLYFDPTYNAWQFVEGSILDNVTGGGGGGNLWSGITIDVNKDMGAHDLNNLTNLRFQGTGAIFTTIGIVTINAPATMNLQIGGVSKATLSASALTMASPINPSADLVYGLGSTNFRWTTLKAQLVQYDSPRLINLGDANAISYLVGAGQTHNFLVNGAQNLLVSGGFVTVNNELIVLGLTALNGSVVLGDSNADRISYVGLVNTDILFDVANTRSLGSASVPANHVHCSELDDVSSILWGSSATTRKIQNSAGLVYNVLGGEIHNFEVNSGTELIIQSGFVEVTHQLVVAGVTSLLSTVFVSGNVLPNLDNFYNCGSTAFRWVVNGIRYLGISKVGGIPSVSELPVGYFTVAKNSSQPSGSGIHLFYMDTGNNLIQLI